jgi:hypothetical protein
VRAYSQALNSAEIFALYTDSDVIYRGLAQASVLPGFGE